MVICTNKILFSRYWLAIFNKCLAKAQAGIDGDLGMELGIRYSRIIARYIYT